MLEDIKEQMKEELVEAIDALKNAKNKKVREKNKDLRKKLDN